MHCSCPMNSTRGASQKRKKKKEKKEGRRRRYCPKHKPNGHLHNCMQIN